MRWRGFPLVRQEFIQPIDGVRGDAREHIPERPQPTKLARAWNQASLAGPPLLDVRLRGRLQAAC
jgi:hypothetical protein